MTVFPDLPGMTAVSQISGDGGYGDVYLYEQHTPRRRVAVKVLRDQHLDDKVRRQFMSEADAMAQLAHPNIVPVYSAGLSADGRPFIVMEYFPGQSLGHRAVVERIGVPEVLSIGVKIGSAVETAHRAGILHRDIKPANILVSRYGEPSLTDFGIAGQLAEVADDDEQGLSLPWAPPEVVFATAPASYSSDVYSLAATLWHLLVGRSPFEVVGSRNTTGELMQRIRALPAPSTGLPIPDSFDRLLRQAMHKDPGQRPQRVRDFVLALNGVEQEMRLRPTKPIIEEAGPAMPSGPARSVPAPSGSRSDATRLKAPIVHQSSGGFTAAPMPSGPSVASGPSGLSGPSGPAGPSEAKTRMRQVVQPGMPPTASPTDATTRRATTGHAPETDRTIRRGVAARPDTHPAETEPAKTPPRYGVIALAAALLVVAVVVGVILTRGGSTAKAPTASSTTSAGGNSALSGDLVPPGPVTVRGTRADGEKVSFTWTYSAAQSSDTFQWRLDDASQSGVTKTPTLELKAPAGTKVCVRVKVVRADGSNPALDWSVPGCAT